MYHTSDNVFMIYMICTFQLQPNLLTMASKPSTSTTTSTTAKQDPMPPPQSTAPGMKESDVTPTSSTPKPVPTSIVQKYVTDAAEMISASPATRKMFLAEVFKKCNEVAKWEEETGKRSPDFPTGPPSPTKRLPTMCPTQTTVMESSSLQGRTKF